MRIERATVGPVQANAYLLIDDATGRSVLIDPGDEGERLLSMVAASGTDLTAVWLTHAHFDHVGGLRAVLRRHDVPVYLHPADLPLLAAAETLATRFGIVVDVGDVSTRPIEHGSLLEVGRIVARTLFTPGHAPGHCSLYIDDQNVVFSGDALFRGSIGRTDLPGTDGPTLLASIARELLPLPADTRVLPGHGPETTIGVEAATNPFLTARWPGG
jgi:glyoxylase-like metal-dependent hydrolase (beta-lactamase superfamily II)